MMNAKNFLLIAVLVCAGWTMWAQPVVTVTGSRNADQKSIWLSHEHILVDFIGADKITMNDYNRSTVFHEMLPYLSALKKYQIGYFVDATPPFLGRDPELLRQLSVASGVSILTNTGLYGAQQNKFIPAYAFDLTAQELSERWIKEYRQGIDDTGIRPGFIKISVDPKDPLDPMHEKIVKAAALTHLETGLTIASHTGKALGLWPQLQILKNAGVSPAAFIWVHAQNESDTDAYIKAAEEGCWISLDGVGWKTELYVEKLRWAKEMDLLDRVLISHDAGWYDPQKEEQSIQPFTNIFEVLIPRLMASGFTRRDIHQLLTVNPAMAFGIDVRKRE
ncbi:hypothetical protein KUV50_10080 [Membranicola marinus]|uniref:Phosphotriesterase-related protein n=1 Tax=Membranihabitans marinus TaxID=1227546 RepID=A0A953LBE4_9BACT|nr:hypothetical protein [Membranihabitans marinus]MBY5958481.1 hypothetical protein [Membranihabitans marinus]